MDSVTYLEIVGIIIGQILVGIEGGECSSARYLAVKMLNTTQPSDWVGRKFGLVQDAVVMLIGVIMLTSVWGATLQGWVVAYTISLFIYGIGGEFLVLRFPFNLVADSLPLQ